MDIINTLTSKGITSLNELSNSNNRPGMKCFSGITESGDKIFIKVSVNKDHILQKNAELMERLIDSGINMPKLYFYDNSKVGEIIATSYIEGEAIQTQSYTQILPKYQLDTSSFVIDHYDRMLKVPQEDLTNVTNLYLKRCT